MGRTCSDVVRMMSDGYQKENLIGKCIIEHVNKQEASNGALCIKLPDHTIPYHTIAVQGLLVPKVNCDFNEFSLIDR